MFPEDNVCCFSATSPEVEKLARQSFSSGKHGICRHHETVQTFWHPVCIQGLALLSAVRGPSVLKHISLDDDSAVAGPSHLAAIVKGFP
jgi:hypothetical protein